MAAIDDNEGAVWESDKPNHETLHVVLDLDISAHLQSEQGQEHLSQLRAKCACLAISESKTRSNGQYSVCKTYFTADLSFSALKLLCRLS